MKKFVIIFFMFIVSFVMIACDGTITLPSGVTTDENWFTTEEPTTGTNVTTEEGMTTEIPTTVDGTTVDGTTEVPTTGTNTTDEITTIDETSEKAAMLTIIQQSQLNLYDDVAFVDELFAKGMRTAGLVNMMSSIGDIEAMNTAATPLEGYTILDTMLGNLNMDDLESMLSAVIKVELRLQLEAQIAAMNAAIEEGGMVYYDNNLEMLTTLLTMIENHGDEVVASVMVGVVYILDVQDMLTPTLMGSIFTLVQKETFTALDITLMKTTKDQIISYLENALPSQQNVELLNTTFIAFLNILAEEQVDFSLVDIQVQAQQQLMSLGLVFDFFLAIDTDYITEMINFAQEASMNDLTPETMRAFIVLNLELLDGFLASHETDIQAIANLTTVQERTDFFYDFIVDEFLSFMLMKNGMESTEITALTTLIHDVIVYNNLDGVPMLMGDVFNDVLDQIIASDYEILDAFIALQSISIWDYEDDFGYFDYEQYDFDRASLHDDMIIALINIINPVLNLRSDADYELIVMNAFMVLDFYIGVRAMDPENTFDYTDVLLALDELENVFLNAAPTQLGIIQEVFNQIVLNDYALIDAINQMDSVREWKYMDEYGIVDWEAYDLAENQAGLDMIIAVLDIVNPIVQNMTDVEYQTLVDIVFAGIKVEIAVLEMTRGMDLTTVKPLVDALEVAYADVTASQLGVLQGVLTTVIANEYEVIRLIIEPDLIDMADYEDEFGEVDWDAYDDAKEAANYIGMMTVVDLVNGVVQNTSEVEYQATLNVLFRGLDIAVEVMELQSGYDLTEVKLDLATFETSFMNLAPVQLNTLITVFNHLSANSYEMLGHIDAALSIDPYDYLDEFGYIDWEAYNSAEALATYTMILDVSELINDITVNATDANYQLFVTAAFDALQLQLEIMEIETSMDYSNMMLLVADLEIAFSDSTLAQLTIMQDILAQVSTNNYELLQLLFDMTQIRESDYLTTEEFYDAIDLATYNFVISAVGAVNNVIQNVDETEYASLLTVAFRVFDIVVEVQEINSGYDLTDVKVALDHFETAFMNFSPVQLDILHDVLAEALVNEHEFLDNLYVMSTMKESDYLTIEAYDLAKSEATYNFSMSVLGMIDTVISDKTDAEYQLFIDTVFAGIHLVIQIQGVDMGVDPTLIATLTYLETLVDATSTNQLGMIQDVLNLAVTSTYINDLYTLLTNTTMTSEEQGLRMGILIASMIDDVYTTIGTDYDIVQVALVNMLQDPMFVMASGIPQVDIDHMLDILTIQIPDMLSLAGTISGYTYETLTPEQTQDIQDFMLIFATEEPTV